VELVASRDSREALTPAGRAGGFISSYCRDAQMILRNNGDILVMAPALVMAREQADVMVGLVEEAIAEAMKHCRTEGDRLAWDK